jgi:hypothetical protein
MSHPVMGLNLKRTNINIDVYLTRFTLQHHPLHVLPAFDLGAIPPWPDSMTTRLRPSQSTLVS